MKLEIRCSSCHQRFLLDEVIAGMELACPACSAPIQVGFDRPAAAAPQPPLALAAPVGEVVCPRCNLHFRPRAESAHGPGPAQDLPTVLVVEDMSYFRELATDALAGAYAIKTATTVDEARAHLRAGGIDLLLLDLTLDGGEFGVDLLRELPHKPCPILIYTAENESDIYGEEWEELQALGADDIVIKGLNVGETLLRKVGSLLGREEEDLVEGNPPR